MSILFVCRLAQADVVDTVLTFDTNTVTSFNSVDFNGDGANDISFWFTGIGFGGGPFTPPTVSYFLDVLGESDSQVLVQGDSVISASPLAPGTTISLTPVLGSYWGNTSFLPSAVGGPNVWAQSNDGSYVAGIGAPGYDDYMGVRFLDGSDWHYGWIRFGPISNPVLPASPFPSVLEYAYETSPDTAIVTPTPEPNTSRLVILFGVFAFGKKLLSSRTLTI